MAMAPHPVMEHIEKLSAVAQWRQRVWHVLNNVNDYSYGSCMPMGYAMRCFYNVAW